MALKFTPEPVVNEKVKELLKQSQDNGLTYGEQKFEKSDTEVTGV